MWKMNQEGKRCEENGRGKETKVGRRKVSKIESE